MENSLKALFFTKKNEQYYKTGLDQQYITQYFERKLYVCTQLCRNTQNDKEKTSCYKQCFADGKLLDSEK